jgi:hypothetical protein
MQDDIKMRSIFLSRKKVGVPFLTMYALCNNEKIVFCDFLLLAPHVFFYGEAYQNPRRNCFAGNDVSPANRPFRGLPRGSPRNIPTWILVCFAVEKSRGAQ